MLGFGPRAQLGAQQPNAGIGETTAIAGRDRGLVAAPSAHHLSHAVRAHESPPDAVAAASLGLVAGGVLGAVAGAGLLLALGDPGRLAQGWGLSVLCAGWGAAVGCLLAPLTARFVLPTVPLQRSTQHAALGTLGGIVIGCVLGPGRAYAVLWPFALGVVGFVVATLRLRRLATREANGRTGHAPSA